MELTSKTKLLGLAIAVSFVTALLTGVIVFALASEHSEIAQNTAQARVAEEELVVRLVESATPAVASVLATKDVTVMEEYYANPFFPIYRQRGIQERQIAAASAFFVSPDGYLVTNKHVVDDTEAEYTLVMNNGKRLPVRVLAKDPMQDIAILKVEGNNFTAIPLGDSDSIKVGQTAVAIGNALGEFQNTVSVGVISGLSRTIIASNGANGSERLSKVIQTDAAINPGNSGGPLLNLEGKAIGINTATAQGAENIGFALPINAVKKAIEDVKSSGRILYPYMGIRYAVINPAVKEFQNLPVDYGALLRSSAGESAVVPGSPAAKTGLKEGDIVLEIAGVKVTQDNTPGDIIAGKRIGDTIQIKLLRDGKEMTVNITLEERK